MTSFDQVKILVHQQREVSPTIAACARALETDAAEPLGPFPGGDLARRVLADFEIRAAAAARAGGVPTGLIDAIEALALVPGEERVTIAHFATVEETFSVFVRDSGERVIGCIVAPRRTRVSPASG